MTLNPRKTIHSLFVYLTLSFLLSSCTFIQLREETTLAKKSAVLVGTVSSTLSFKNLPVVVAAYSTNNNKRSILHYTTLHEPGPYELMVPIGTHNIVAFGDMNKNLSYDPGEPAGQILDTDQVSAPTGGVAGNLDIVLLEYGSITIDFPIGETVPPKEHNTFHSTSPGAIAELDDYLFSNEYGRKGFWSALEFFKEISGNVYFLEEYDPEKIPILFVHGAAGSPQDWRTFFESIDRSKYQPWLFYYPSGAAIDSMAYLLFWKLQNLHTKYKFKELYFTAHSMGGLVVRSFLVNYGPYFPNITNFVSISTPWGGEELAELGVKYAPAVIPAWRDMQPESDFLNSIFRKKMPPTVEHYLLFGHKGNRNILRPNNDKAVTLASQLDQRSQKDAKMIYGFNEDHVSILSSEQVLSQYNTILADIDQQTGTSDNISGNRLHVDFSFDFPEELPKPMTVLLLRPVDKKGDATLLYLGPDDSGREHGPFPSGNYEVSMIAQAFTPTPLSIPIRIEEGTVPKVEFAMKPAGHIRGFVVKHEPNIQAGKDRQPDTEVGIQSITLQGNGIDRTLTPLKGGASYSDIFPEHYLSGTDFSTAGTFFFFGLAKGKYELTIKAEGYEPYSRSYDVRPGQYQNTITVELVKSTIENP